MMLADDSANNPTERNCRYLLNNSTGKRPTSDIEIVDRLYCLVTATAKMIAETLYMHAPNNKSLHKLSDTADALLFPSEAHGGVFQGFDTISKFNNAPAMFQLGKECLYELGKLITSGLKK
ncbi:uncharacterized protein LTHEOB_1032 [Lasiodiplodia theobromae]|uniref:uncharacterized protein n=1 Tax=Lasiodiplodia theobromae TaxID=45133 RepID=UPI0015C31C46|nr:uncharacterized protein LTHEOB_1032 [Lasiodiplodia theobromae]KAF4538678.1 hypothetical protein LTHEOB_1032 [Lasiodiplodia theobromae]